MRRLLCLWAFLPFYLLNASNCDSSPQEVLTDFRIRSEFELPLNAHTGWAAGINEMASIDVDRPFRLRLQIQSEDEGDALRHYVLWYRRNGGPWQPVVDADFPYPAYASPTVSLVSPSYSRGDATKDLLPQTDHEHGEDGAGQGLAPVSTRAGETGVASEWEFPLVIRYFADGPIRIDDGDEIEFRLGRLHGDFLVSAITPTVRVRVPDQHIGGTFVETPGRIGPWQSGDGSLYFIMEPTETDNRFMMVKSTDGGNSWKEVDGQNRPPARDLEAVDAVCEGNLIHIIHMEDVVWYHAFRMTSGEGSSEGWVTQSELIGEPAKPPVQSVGLEILSDGTLLAFHADGTGITMRSRGNNGRWPVVTHEESTTRYSGIQVVQGEGNRVYIAYSDGEGNAWIQLSVNGNPPAKRWLLSSRLGRSEADVGSILTPVFSPGDETVAIVYREHDGSLHERRLDTKAGVLSDPVRVVKGPVIQNAVDSDQTGADLIAHKGVLHLFYIPEASRDILYTKSIRPGSWSDPVTLVHGIEGSWIRANGLQDGTIGFVYDAGSLGGSGMNRFEVLSGVMK